MKPSSSLALAGEWLLHSGIQSPNGGVARYYRTDLKRNEPVSTEITGYTASGLVYLFQKTGRSIFADRAILTARFLAQEAWNPELSTFPFEYPELTPAFFFDSGIIVRGLLAVWRMSGEQAFLDAAVAGGESMIRDFDSGSDFHPILELPSKQPAARDARWSRSSGCYQLKSGMAWRELFDVTGAARFGLAFDRLMQFANATEADFLPGSDDENRVMDRLHAYCYYLEALVSYGLDVRSGVERVAGYLHRISARFARADVYAQLLRIRILSGVGLERAPFEVAALERFQAPDEEPCNQRLVGGYHFGSKSGLLLPYMNPVSTIFAMQAREMWEEHRAGRIERDCLVII